MAKQTICDRSKNVIPDGEDYFQLTARNEDGTESPIDLCVPCGNDFKAFMNPVKSVPPVAPVAPAQEQVAAPQEAPQPQSQG